MTELLIGCSTPTVNLKLVLIPVDFTDLAVSSPDKNTQVARNYPKNLQTILVHT